MRFSVECAFPHLRKRGVGSRKSAFWQVGSRKSASCALGLTEKHTLWLRRDGKAQSGPRPQSTPHGKAHSARWVSRKSALWPRPRGAPHQKAHSGDSGARRMRLSVTSNSRMRFSVECAFPHLRKRGVGSRKSAFCPDGLTERRSLWLRRDGKAQSGPRPQSTPHGKAHFGRAPGARLTKRRTLAGASPPECVST